MKNPVSALSAAVILAAVTTNLQAEEPAVPQSPYMGGHVELATAPNGAIANKRLLDGIGKVGWLAPTIEQPVEGIWVFGGYGLAPIAVLDTDEGLIAFDTGDTKHDGELLVAAIRTITDKPIVYSYVPTFRPSVAWSDHSIGIVTHESADDTPLAEQLHGVALHARIHRFLRDNNR